MTFQESPATLPHRINSNRNTKYWRTSWFVHESWNVMNYCRKEKGILLFSPPKQRRQVNLFSKTNNWLAEARFPILSPDRKMTITQMLVAYGFTQIERVWRKPLHLWDEFLLDSNKLLGLSSSFSWEKFGILTQRFYENCLENSILGLFLLEKSMIFLKGSKSHQLPAPRFTWSRNRSAAALSGRGPNKDPGFLKKNLSFSRDMLVSGRVMHQKRRLLQDLFVVSWIEQKKYCSHWMFDDGFVLRCFESGFWRASSDFGKVVIGALYFLKCQVIIITCSWHLHEIAWMLATIPQGEVNLTIANT